MESFDVGLEHDRHLVYVHVFGPIDEAQVETIVTAARSLANEHAYGLLYDARQAKPMMEMEELYHLPRELAVFEDPQARVTPAAIVIAEDADPEIYQFYELIMHNLGFAVKVFRDEDEARTWIAARTS